MKRFILTIVAILCITSAVNAATTFTFDNGGLHYASLDTKISQYMTSMYGNQVTSSGAFVAKSNYFNSSYFISTFIGQGGNFTLTFREQPITTASFDWYVFDATTGTDFTCKAYDQAGNLVDTLSYTCGNYTGGHSNTIIFDTPVRRLYFSNAGFHDVAIDNLTVNYTNGGGSNGTPAPGAVLLSTLGAGLVGWLRRRRTL